MITQSLFPTAVSFFKYEELTDKEKKVLVEQDKRINEGNSTSVNHYILKNEKLSKLKKFIDACLKEYLDTIYNPSKNVEVYVTQSWCNYTKENEYHHSHTHPNSFISGVFYVQADRKKDKIYFSREKKNVIDLPPVNYNLFNSKNWWFETHTNDLILFPSHLEHMVSKVEGKERISLSFNTFIKGELGDDFDLTSLHL